MSLHSKLKQVKGKVEEKTIALRMPKQKVQVLEKLAEFYGTNTSTLVREMIDDAIMKLQKDLIVFPDELGVESIIKGEKRLITYFPDIVAIYTNDSYPYSFNLQDTDCNKEALDEKIMEDAKLSVEKGISEINTGITPYSKKEYYFTRGGK